MTYFARSLMLLALLSIAGCKASEPGKMETSIMQTMKQKVTIGGKDQKNPVPFTAQALHEGQAHFSHHCQICHGLDGQNTGVPFAAKMDPPVADLKDKDIQEYTDGQLKWIIENGIGPSGMPGWKGIVEEDEMWKMVHFIRHLPAKGSLGVPDFYKEEAEEHQELKAVEGQTGKAPKPHTHTHQH